MLQVGDAVAKFNTEATKLFNLDETSMSPGKDIHGASRKRALTEREILCRAQAAHFDSNVHRLILLGAVNGGGESFCTLWVFKGSGIPYFFLMKTNGTKNNESIPSVLPRTHY